MTILNFRQLKGAWNIILLFVLTSGCQLETPPVVNEAWVLAEVVSGNNRTDKIEQVVEVSACNVVEQKSIECSAGTSSDLSIETGGNFGSVVNISASTGTSLGFTRDSVETLALESPPKGFVYRYIVIKEYNVLVGEALAISSSGQERKVAYAFQASCSLQVESQERR